MSRIIGRPEKRLSEGVIRNAMKHTQSNHQAARYLRMSYDTYRKYAKLYVDQETGKTLFDLHKNSSGKGINRVRWNDNFSAEKLDDILTKSQYKAFSIEKIKSRLLYEGKLRHECYRCGHSEKRVVDYKQPVVLNFKNGDKHDWRFDNLEMICYNCHFLYVGNLYTEKQIRNLEDVTSPELKKAEIDLDIDDHYLQHFKELGLLGDDDYQDGDEYISKI
jgi:5-methylcytosine-specific restriction endonuclease McrA